MAPNAGAAGCQPDRSVRLLVNGLSAACDARDPATQDHANRVMTYVSEIGVRLGLSPVGLERLQFAAELHDIGKLAISERILSKTGKLKPEEFEEIKVHCEAGEKILRAAGLGEVATIVRSHHERWDGGGYPDGLSGKAIPLESRILVGADSLDAMTTHRFYREPMTLDEARPEVKRCAGSHFDPRVAAAMVAIIDAGIVRSVAGRSRP